MFHHSNPFIGKESIALRNIVLLAGMAFLAGCVVVAHPGQPRRNDAQRDNRPLVVQSTPSYEGYFYARVIFINNVPYYVSDDRNVRPIPPHLHNHFRKYSYGTIREPVVFSRDTEVRDGYAMSRIVYLNGVPYHVTDDRVARPLPGHLHQRFGLMPPNQATAPANGNGVQPPVVRDDNKRNEAPAYGRERNEPPAYGQGRGPASVPVNVRDRARFGQPPLGREHGDNGNRPQPPIARNDDRPNQPPANGLEKEQNVPPARGWNQEHTARPPLERPQHDQRPNHDSARSQGNMMPPAAGNDSRRTPPAQQQQANLRQDQRNADKGRGGAPGGDGRSRNDGRAQANNDTNKKGSDKQDAREEKDGSADKEADDKNARGNKDSGHDADDTKGKKRD